MLFTVSPSAVHLETTMSTLRYASTTRNIVNVATVNEDPKGRIIGYAVSAMWKLWNALAELTLR